MGDCQPTFSIGQRQAKRAKLLIDNEQRFQFHFDRVPQTVGVVIMSLKVLSLGCLALAGYALTANGQFSDNFNSGTDTSWTHWGPGPATNNFTFPTISVGNLGYRLESGPGTASFATSARAGSY